MDSLTRYAAAMAALEAANQSDTATYAEVRAASTAVREARARAVADGATRAQLAAAFQVTPQR
jgi:hypothetical protein